MRRLYPTRGEGVSLVGASKHELVVEGLRPRFKLMHLLELAVPIGDFSVAGYSDQTGVRFDCSHWQHRLVVASQWHFNLHGSNSGRLQICSRSAAPISAIGAVTAQPQHTKYV